ncbi:HNH endonuclease signature motif containing protein [Streptomyces sp. NPDC003233]
MEIEHIEDWARVKEHKFDNLIALCPTCHARKGNGPGQIDRKALHQYKTNLAVLTSRYSDAERRLIEHYAKQMELRPGANLLVPLPFGMDWQITYLVRDGYLEKQLTGLGLSISGLPLVEFYSFTEAGVEFVQRWAQARPLDPPGDDS